MQRAQYASYGVVCLHLAYCRSYEQSRPGSLCLRGKQGIYCATELDFILPVRPFSRQEMESHVSFHKENRENVPRLNCLTDQLGKTGCPREKVLSFDEEGSLTICYSRTLASESRLRFHQDLQDLQPAARRLV